MRGRSGQPVSSSGHYSASCCGVVEKLIEGQTFPRCSNHEDTEWNEIPPFVQSDFGMNAVLAHWNHLESQRGRAVMAQGVALGIAVFDSIRTNESITPVTGSLVTNGLAPILDTDLQILLQHGIISLGAKTDEGQIVEAVTPAWIAVVDKILRDRIALYEFSKYSREFEELIAGAYERDQWEVILTPRSGDRGRDIIATKPGFVSIRIVDQVKAFARDHRVTANDVSSLLGVLLREPNVSKGVVTTSSQFAPGIEKDPGFKHLMEGRLQLRDGKQLREWLSVFYKNRF